MNAQRRMGGRLRLAGIRSSSTQPRASVSGMSTTWPDLDAVSDRVRATLAASTAQARAIVAEAARGAEQIERAGYAAYEHELDERRARLQAVRSDIAGRADRVESGLRSIAGRMRAGIEGTAEGNR